MPALAPETLMNGLQPLSLLEIVPHLSEELDWYCDATRLAYSVVPESTTRYTPVGTVSGADRNALFPPLLFSSTDLPVPLQALSALWIREVSGGLASALLENCSLLVARFARQLLADRGKRRLVNGAAVAGGHAGRVRAAGHQAADGQRSGGEDADAGSGAADRGKGDSSHEPCP